MTCVGCGSSFLEPAADADGLYHCRDCHGYQVSEEEEMSASNEHQHACIRCGDLFACWCTNPLDVEFQRMCPHCGEQHARIKDAHWPRGVHFRRPNDFRRR